MFEIWRYASPDGRGRMSGLAFKLEKAAAAADRLAVDGEWSEVREYGRRVVYSAGPALACSCVQCIRLAESVRLFSGAPAWVCGDCGAVLVQGRGVADYRRSDGVPGFLPYR
jgi:hypothetical protein